MVVDVARDLNSLSISCCPQSIDDARNLKLFGTSYVFYIVGKGLGSPLHLNSGDNVTSK